MKLRAPRTLLVVAVAAAVTGGTVLLAAPAFAAGLTATFSKTTQSGGYSGKYTMTNSGGADVNGWTVTFDLPTGTSITSTSRATITSSGIHYTAKNHNVNKTIPAGGSVWFTFVTNGSGDPSNCLLNGASCTGGGGGDTTAPTVPAGLAIGATTSSTISLSWAASTDAVGVTGYDVQRDGTSVGTPTGASFTDTGLSASTAYSYRVRARDAAGNWSGWSAAVSARTQGGSGGGGSKMAAPYLYNGWGDPPAATTVMQATGIKSFTMAFMLAGSASCNPMWDSQRALAGGVDEQTIKDVRAKGGDVEISFGGWSGDKLGTRCTSATALAAAYQKVIDAYSLKYIDIDIENSDEFENATVMDRILGALKIVKQKNPGITTILTFGVDKTGPTSTGVRLINQSKALGANVDVYTIMPFDFGSSDMLGDTVKSAEGTKNQLMSTFGWSATVAYSHLGISSMNGLTDSKETVTPEIYTKIRDYAKGNGLARLAFWSVNRDRPCPGHRLAENCSSIAQTDWQFTGITAGF